MCADNQGYQHCKGKIAEGVSTLVGMNQPKTRPVTLHRLSDIPATHDGMWDALMEHAGEKRLRELGAYPDLTDVDGQPAVWTGFQGPTRAATWCADAAITTGVPMPYETADAGGVLLFVVDGIVYEISYGSGCHLFPDEVHDQRFGLRFLIRCLDPGRVQAIVRRRPDARGRTDSTLVPSGVPVWTLGIMESAEIVRRVGGLADDLDVTYATKTGTSTKVTGGAGLQMRLAVAPGALVADVREVERVCRERKPHESFAFIDYIQPIASTKKKAELDARFDGLLGTSDGGGQVVPVVPVPALDDLSAAHSFTLQIGSGTPPPRDQLELRYFLQRTRPMRADTRMAALRKGHVRMNADDGGTEALARLRADRWLEAHVSDADGRRFFYMDGHWYEIGDQYVQASRHEIARLFPHQPSLDLPPWYLASGRDEGNYNAHVPCVRGGYVCLDKNKRVRDPLGRSRSSVEICDLLGPDNELIHVKRAKGSAPLSHLFSQGLVSVQTLRYGPHAAREQFATEVRRLGKGKTLDPDFRPKKVVFAILMENGKELTADTLYPFSQVTLAHVARVLGTYDIEVEVIGIRAA
jgi:uncharacterized protein (TIGR04141 family)